MLSVIREHSLLEFSMLSRDVTTFANKLAEKTSDDDYLIKFLNAVVDAHHGVENSVARMSEGQHNSATISALSSGLKETSKAVQNFQISQVFYSLSEHKAFAKAFVSNGLMSPESKLIRSYQDFETALNRNLQGYSQPTAHQLAKVAHSLRDELFAWLEAYRGMSFELTNERFDSEGALDLILTADMSFDATVAKLSALSKIYSELCEFCHLSQEEHPIRIGKIESGSLWTLIFGEPKIIACIANLIENTAKFLHRQFTIDGKIRDVPKKFEVVEQALAAVERLENNCIDQTEARDQLAKSSVKIAGELNTLLSHEPLISVNGRSISVTDDHQQKLLPAGPKRLTGPNTSEDSRGDVNGS